MFKKLLRVIGVGRDNEVKDPPERASIAIKQKSSHFRFCIIGDSPKGKGAIWEELRKQNATTPSVPIYQDECKVTSYQMFIER